MERSATPNHKVKTSSRLPLRYHTPNHWARVPLSNLRALLSDHAYLERKAASNALELLNRWPEPNHPDPWTEMLSSIARDETVHLQQVIREVRRRGWQLERLHRSAYAGDLRRLVRMGRGPEEVVDRLLVSGLIEARSCERFGILASMCEESNLRNFYQGLHSAEFGHYHVFVTLAEQVLPKKAVREQWHRMLDEEASIIQNQPVGPGLHSGC